VRDELVKLFKPGQPQVGQAVLCQPTVMEPDGAHGVTRPTTIASRGLKLLHETGLLAEVLPEIAACLECEQSPDFHPEGNVFNHLCLMLAQLPVDADPLLPWAVLLHDVAKPVTVERDLATGSIHFYGHEKVGADMAVDILTRLRFPKKQVEDVHSGAAPYAVQGCAENAQGHVAAHAATSDVPLGAGAAPARLPRFARAVGRV